MVNVYYLKLHELEDVKIFNELYDKVNKLRQQKINKNKCIDGKINSLGAGILLKYALDKSGFDYNTIKFFTDEFGAIRVANSDRLQVSVSHSSLYCACAISDEPIGIDIERISRFHKSNFVKRCYTESEKNFVYKNEQDKYLRMAKVWTRKEAYSKKMGKGLFLDFKKINTINETPNCYADYIVDDMQISVCSDLQEIENVVFQEVSLVQIREL